MATPLPPHPSTPLAAAPAVTPATTRLPEPVVCVPYDGSHAAGTALPLAGTVARQLGAGLELLTTEEGDAAAAILAASVDPRVALVVLTTHGGELEPGRGLGGVAEAVMAGCERPVLLVRPEAAGRWGGCVPPLSRLLFPLDGTQETLAALKPAIALAGQLGAAVHLLYVVPAAGQEAQAGSAFRSPRYVDQPQHEWRQWRHEVEAQVAGQCGAWPAAMAVHSWLRVGAIADEIVAAAVARQSDAIVLVRSSHLEPGRAAVLRAVVAATPCPVLLLSVPAPGT